MQRLAFNSDTLQKISDHLEYMPFEHVSFGVLGGTKWIYIRLSFEKKDTWKHGIYNNSNNLMLCFGEDGVIELQTISLYQKGTSPSLETRLNKKFRKCTVNTFEEFFKKIDKYLKDILAYYNSENN